MSNASYHRRHESSFHAQKLYDQDSGALSFAAQYDTLTLLSVMVLDSTAATTRTGVVEKVLAKEEEMHFTLVVESEKGRPCTW
jgi:hypothetical protein